MKITSLHVYHSQVQRYMQHVYYWFQSMESFLKGR